MASTNSMALVPVSQLAAQQAQANQGTSLQVPASQVVVHAPSAQGVVHASSTQSIQRTKPQIPFESIWEELLFLIQRLFINIRLKYWDALGESDQAIARLFRERMDEKAIVAAYDMAFLTSRHIVKLSNNLDVNRDSQLIERLIQIIDTAVYFTEVRCKLEALCEVRTALQSLVPTDAPLPESYLDQAQEQAAPGNRFARSTRAHATMLTRVAAAGIADGLKNKTDATAHAQAVSDFKALPTWKQLNVVDMLSPKQLTTPLLASICDSLSALPVDERMLVRAYLVLHNSHGLVSDDTEQRHTGKKYGSIVRAWDVVSKYRAKTHAHESVHLTQTTEAILLQAVKRPKAQNTRVRA